MKVGIIGAGTMGSGSLRHLPRIDGKSMPVCINGRVCFHGQTENFQEL